MIFSYVSILFAAFFLRGAQAQTCDSAGVDIGNGGTYYINPASGAPFSLQTVFIGAGCDPAQSATVQLQLPNGQIINCSPIPETSFSQTSTW
jgi:hypothetical protein